MTFAKSALAFEDIKEIFERALNAPKGIKITFGSRFEAVNLRVRCNYYRKLTRADNAKIYPAEHPMHGTSVYDKLVLSIPKGTESEPATLYIKPRTSEDMQIDDL